MNFSLRTLPMVIVVASTGAFVAFCFAVQAFPGGGCIRIEGPADVLLDACIGSCRDPLESPENQCV